MPAACSYQNPNLPIFLKVDHAAAIKEYSRSSADQEEPLPHDLRPLPVLCMTMDYLVTKIMDQNSEAYRDWYDFVWNRTRGIRKVTQIRSLSRRRRAVFFQKLHCLLVFPAPTPSSLPFPPRRTSPSSACAAPARCRSSRSARASTSTAPTTCARSPCRRSTPRSTTRTWPSASRVSRKCTRTWQPGRPTARGRRSSASTACWWNSTTATSCGQSIKRDTIFFFAFGCFQLYRKSQIWSSFLFILFFYPPCQGGAAVPRWGAQFPRGEVCRPGVHGGQQQQLCALLQTGERSLVFGRLPPAPILQSGRKPFGINNDGKDIQKLKKLFFWYFQVDNVWQ